MTISYATNTPLDLDAVIEIYIASTLGERRPVADREAMAAMLQHANLTIGAWDGDRLVGLSRSLTDFAYCCYLADLAVHADYQRQGIGLELIRHTRAALGPNAFLTLLSGRAGGAAEARSGLSPHRSAWILYPGDKI
jgi:predicted GNAT superfamily acetyltransferase